MLRATQSPPHRPRHRAVLALAVVAVVVGVVAVAGSCAGARPVTQHGAASAATGAWEQCPVDPERFVTVDDGELPLVLSLTHGGTAVPKGCTPGTGDVRALDTRSCTPSLDLACDSGPCRAAGPDTDVRLLAWALRDDLTRCLGARPALVVADVTRRIADPNRDVDDAGGMRCALEDVAAKPYWQAFHAALARTVKRAVDEGGDHALLVDVHTFATLPKAPAPAIMLGSGKPVGLTLPHERAEDPSLPLVYGAGGLRARLLELLAPAHPGLQVLPASPDDDDDALDGLFVGRYVVRHYSGHGGVDALQLEISSGLRDDVEGTARAIAAALCGAYGPRLHTRGAPVAGGGA